MTEPVDPQLAARIDRVERALAELTEAVLLAVRNGPAHYEQARSHAHTAKGLLPRHKR